MIALTYPWIIGLLVVVALILAVRKRFVIGGICFLIALLLNWYCECFAFGVSWSSDTADGKLIRVMSWNVNAATSTSKEELEGIAEVICAEDPDVVFIAELFLNASDTLTQIMVDRYPYTTYLKQEYDRGHYVYSKYRLSDHKFMTQNEWNGLVLLTMVYIGNDSLLIYGCHLASNNYDAEMKYMTPDSVGTTKNAFKYLENIQRASAIRTEQCDSIVSDMRKYNAPCIVMGDMNDVCGSPCMKVYAEAGLRDAWWDGGFGYGATIHKPLAYRIDHVLYSEGFKLKGIKKVSSKGLSDHDALVADFEIR